MIKKIFTIGETLSKREYNILAIFGVVMLLLFWHVVTVTGLVPPKILPNPSSVALSFKDLFSGGDTSIFSNMLYSIKLNLLAYAYALVIAIPIGFLIGLVPFFDGVLSKYTDALRFLPLPCISGIFIAMLGLGLPMKSSFLAFGILLFLIPSIVNHIHSIQNPNNDKDFVYLQTIKTLGATTIQKIRFVYWPYVMGGVFKEIINLVSISWTYLVIAECLNKEGGLGALIHTLARQSRMSDVYACLFIIVLIGITQDFLLKKLDRAIFPYKYN